MAKIHMPKMGDEDRIIIFLVMMMMAMMPTVI